MRHAPPFARPDVAPPPRHRGDVGRAELLEARVLLAVFTVDTTSDVTDAADNRTTFREALALADAAPGADTVRFSAALTAGGPATVVLSAQVILRGVLTLAGPGPDQITLSGNDMNRVMSVFPGARVSIAGVAISRGRDTYGAGIENLGTLTLTSCLVSGNVMTGTTGPGSLSGAGIYNQGSLALNLTRVARNFSVSAGAGIDNRGTLTIGNGLISDNIASAGPGGGILNSGTLSLQGTTLSGNVGNGGAGIYNTGWVTASSTNVSSNSGGGDRLIEGGGVYTDGTAEFTDSVVRDNSATGVNAGGITNLGRLTLTNTTVSGNRSAGDGGGLYGLGLSTTTLNGCAVWGNSAGVNGGGIASSGTLRAFNSTISGNSAGGSGGGIRNSRTLSLTQCTVVDNKGFGAGGLLAGGDATLTNTILARNVNENEDTPSDIIGTVNGPASRSNVIGGGGSGGLVNGVNGNRVGVADPGLSGLANFGGATPVHALLPGSPALDAGDNALAVGPTGAPLTTDQRGAGFPRVVNGRVDVGAFEAQPPPAAAVVGRHVFYNDSAFDGNNTAANSADDNAIAAGKRALLPGQAASGANFTGYSRGLNGVMIDVRGLPVDLTLSAQDFVFKAGNTDDAFSWDAAPAPAAVALRRGAGDGGSDRVTITWADGAIVNRWLQVTVRNNRRTDLPAPDVFYFGNLAGDTGGAAAAAVNALDLSLVRRSLNRPASVNDAADVNRDRVVNALDLAAVRRGLNRNLALFTPYADPLAVYIDLNRSGTFEWDELVLDSADVGVVETSQPVFIRILNTGPQPAVLDGDFVMEERSPGPGPSFSVRLRHDLTQSVVLVGDGLRARTLPDGRVVQDRVFRFRSVADPSQPKVLAPGEAVELELDTAGVLGAAAGSGAPTRRGRKLRFAGVAS